MTTDTSGHNELFEGATRAKSNAGERRRDAQEDREKRVMVIDTECDLELSNLREIAWCVFNGEHTSLETYFVTIEAPENTLLTTASALPPDTALSLLQVPQAPVTAKQSSHTTGRNHVTAKQALLALATAVNTHRPSCVVGHNIEFDIGVIRAFAQRTGTPLANFLSLPRLCTILATYRSHGAGQFLTLGSLHEKLFGNPHRHAHNALADTEACARCYWKLRNDGHLSGYDHQKAIKASKSKSWAEVERQSRRLVRSLIHSVVAKQAHQERAQAGSEYCGGVDQIVLSRIRQLPPDQLSQFRQRFSALYSSSSAAHICRVIASSPGEHIVKPETAWRCVKTYCLIAPINERKELFMAFCLRRKRPQIQVELELGGANTDALGHIEKWTGLTDHLDTHLSDLSGGDVELKARCLAEHINQFSNQARELAELIARCAREERACLGQHNFELPWTLLSVTVRLRSLLKRIFASLR